MYKYSINTLIYTFLLFSFLFAQDDIIIDPDNYGDRLKIGYVWQGELSFNPLILNYDYDKELIKLVFGDGLFTQGNDSHIVHNLALESKVQTPTVLRFVLRPDLKFHDGSLITAEDVKYSYELYKKFALQSPRHFKARLINSIEVWGSDIIRIFLKNPIPDFSETIGKLPILPKNICKIWLKHNSLSELPNITPIGFGNFKFSEYEQNKSIKLDSYIKHSFGQSYISGVDLLFFETQERMLEAFLKDEVDLIQINDKSEVQKIVQFSKKIIRSDNDERNLYYINLNTRNLPFRVIGLRKAINYAINKEQIISYLSKNENGSFSELTTNHIGKWQYFTPFAYKPLNTLQILQNSRFKKNSQGKLVRNKKELQFELYIQKGSLFEESIARIIAINLGDIGINVVPLSIEPDKLNKKISQGQYQAVLRNFNYNPEHVNETLRNFYFNELNNQGGFQNYKNANIDLILNFTSMAANKSSIVTLSNTFQNQLNRYSPCIFLFFKENNIYAVNPRFENILTTTINNYGSLVNLLKPKHEWFVKKENQKY